MGQLLRRILWLLPTLFAVTVLGFWLISGASGARQARQLPTFVNPHPEDVSKHAWRAAQEIAAANDPLARARLAWLGGAALPHILQRLDSLPPEGRERVALALLPVAIRMGLLPPSVNIDGARALSVWIDFWEERFVDFRNTGVKRAVERYVDNGTPMREQEVARLDTFALDEVMTQLARVGSKLNPPPPAEQAAIAALTRVAAHATGMAWTAAPDASAAELMNVRARWLGWWAEGRFEFTAPQGVERFLAPVLQTRYASWAREAARTRFGLARDGTPTLSVLRQRAPTTLTLFASGTLGLWFGSLLAALVRSALRPVGSHMLTYSVWLLTPGVLLLLSRLDLRDGSYAIRLVLTCLTCFFFAAALILNQQNEKAQQALTTPWARGYRIMGVSSLRLSWLTLRSSSAVAAAGLLPNAARILTAVTTLEVLFDLPGLGPYTLQAIRESQVNWLMVVTIATATGFGTLQLLTDTWLRTSSRLGPLRDEWTGGQ